jgi:SAM-dependent methyltransferase
VGTARPFAGATASCYARYRRGYPPGLVERLGGVRGGRLLDLGCGTGALVCSLALSFEHAVGMDPEPDMLREARRAARERGIGNVTWIRAGSTDLGRLAPRLGRLDLVTIGTAFHLMDARATLVDLQRIAPGGAVAVAYNGTPMWLHPDPWARALRRALESRLGRLDDVDFTAKALRAAEDGMRDLGYSGIELWEQTAVETVGVDFVVGHILSAIPEGRIPPSERQGFAHDLTSAVTAVEPSGRVVETVTARAVVGRTRRDP